METFDRVQDSFFRFETFTKDSIRYYSWNFELCVSQLYYKRWQG